MMKDLCTKLNISPKVISIMFGFSLLLAVGCILLWFPGVRNFIIAIGEVLTGHTYSYAVFERWHNTLIQWSISGLVLYILLIAMIVYEPLILKNRLDPLRYKFILPVVMAGVIFLIFFHANWIFGDDMIFIPTTAKNKFIPFTHYVGIYEQDGRFFPLGSFHFNLALLVCRLLGIKDGMPVFAHYIVIACFYIVTVVCLYQFFTCASDREGYKNFIIAFFFVCMFPLLSSTFQMLYMRLIFPETIIVMLFVIFMYSFYKAMITDKLCYYLTALFSVVYATYCKEPVFGALLITALVNLIFRHHSQTEREKGFHFLIIVNGLVFLVLYYIISYRNSAAFYNDGRVVTTLMRMLVLVVSKSPIVLIILLLGIIRAYYIIIKKDREHVYYDSLLFSGLGYMFAYIILRLELGYYYLPGIILALPAIVYWSNFLYKKNCVLSLALLFPICFIMSFNMVYDIRLVKDTLRTRREFMPYISALYREHQEGKKFIWYEPDDMIAKNSMTKVIGAWRKSVLNSFLNGQNQSDGVDFFTVETLPPDNLIENNIYFCLVDNNQRDPVSGDLNNRLLERGFTMFKYDYDIAVYIFDTRESQWGGI